MRDYSRIHHHLGEAQITERVSSYLLLHVILLAMPQAARYYRKLNNSAIDECINSRGELCAMGTSCVHCAVLDAASATERLDMKDLMKWLSHLAHEAIHISLYLAFHKYALTASMVVKCLSGFWAVSSASTFEEAIWRLVLCIGSMSLDIVWYVGGLMAKRRLNKLVSKEAGLEPATR